MKPRPFRESRLKNGLEDRVTEERERWRERRAAMKARRARLRGDPAATLAALRDLTWVDQDRILADSVPAATQAAFQAAFGQLWERWAKLSKDLSVLSGADTSNGHLGRRARVLDEIADSLGAERAYVHAHGTESEALLRMELEVLESVLHAIGRATIEEVKKVGRWPLDLSATARVAQAALADLDSASVAIIASLLDSGDPKRRGGWLIALSGYVAATTSLRKNRRLLKACEASGASPQAALHAEVPGALFSAWRESDRALPLTERFRKACENAIIELEDGRPRAIPRDRALVPEPLPRAEDRIELYERLQELQRAEERLTARELAVYRLGDQGLGAAEIAGRLGIKRATVYVLRGRIVKKLG